MRSIARAPRKMARLLRPLSVIMTGEGRVAFCVEEEEEMGLLWAGFEACIWSVIG